MYVYKRHKLMMIIPDPTASAWEGKLGISNQRWNRFVNSNQAEPNTYVMKPEQRQPEKNENVESVGECEIRACFGTGAQLAIGNML